MSEKSPRRERLDAFSAGYRAYLAGVSAGRNPYPLRKGLLRQAWYRGYAVSRTDRQRQNTGAGGQDH